MSVAWKVGAWATNSWVGMNGGPPNAWNGAIATAAQELGGSIRFDQKAPKKKKKRVLTYAEFTTQEERAVALATALAEQSIPIALLDEEEDMDDELLLMALTRLIH